MSQKMEEKNRNPFPGMLRRKEHVFFGSFIGVYITDNLYLFLKCICVTMINVPISGDFYPSPPSVLIKEYILHPRTRNKNRGPNQGTSYPHGKSTPRERD